MTRTKVRCTCTGGFDSAVPTGLESLLRPLCEQARQAGVELSCETIATDWQVKMYGLHDPMPAVLEALARCLSGSDEPSPAPAPMIAIRELLKALPACCAGVQPEPQGTTASWATARWQGLVTGLPATCEAAIKAAAARLPGQPATLPFTPQALDGQKRWHAVNTESSEAALLLFCPAPTRSRR